MSSFCIVDSDGKYHDLSNAFIECTSEINDLSDTVDGASANIYRLKEQFSCNVGLSDAEINRFLWRIGVKKRKEYMDVLRRASSSRRRSSRSYKKLMNLRIGKQRNEV